MSARAEMVAKKMRLEYDEEAKARAMCEDGDEKCYAMAKALVKLRNMAERQKKFHVFEKYAYKDMDDALKEVGF